MLKLSNCHKDLSKYVKIVSSGPIINCSQAEQTREIHCRTLDIKNWLSMV